MWLHCLPELCNHAHPRAKPLFSMVPRIGRVRTLQWLLTLQLMGIFAHHAYGQSTCTEGQANDALVGQTQLFGNKNISDSIWQDQLPFYREYGPITKITAYKATEYDNLYHDPGELKGFQFWYGPDEQPPIYKYEDGDENLFGARKPHIPGDFVLSPGELINKVELQWDPISMRGVRFWTNLGRKWEWGFLDVPGATHATSYAPVKGAYLAAMRGFEGKPRAGISKKRYLIQIALVWAVPTCEAPGAPPAKPVQLPPSPYAASHRLATSLYLLDPDTVSLIPPEVEGANIVYDGVTIQYPPPNEGLEFFINATHMIGIKVDRPTQPIGTPTVPTKPSTSPDIIQERTVRANVSSPVPLPAGLPQSAPQTVTAALPESEPQTVTAGQRIQQQPAPQRNGAAQPCSSVFCWFG